MLSSELTISKFNRNRATLPHAQTEGEFVAFFLLQTTRKFKCLAVLQETYYDIRALSHRVSLYYSLVMVVSIHYGDYLRPRHVRGPALNGRYE